MGVSIDTGGKAANKKPVDAELNLIPFIDLLVCCICFLLITAVWIQLAQIQVNQKSPGAGGQVTEPLQRRLAVFVGDEGYTVSLGGERLVIPKLGRVYDTKGLLHRLRQVKVQLPQMERVTVAAEDGVQYRHLIRTMDLARRSHFEQIQVSDAAARL
jgi:biopolymer transport protein ExbD